VTRIPDKDERATPYGSAVTYRCSTRRHNADKSFTRAVVFACAEHTRHLSGRRTRLSLLRSCSARFSPPACPISPALPLTCGYSRVIAVACCCCCYVFLFAPSRRCHWWFVLYRRNQRCSRWRAEFVRSSNADARSRNAVTAYACRAADSSATAEPVAGFAARRTVALYYTARGHSPLQRFSLAWHSHSAFCCIGFLNNRRIWRT